MLHFKCVFFADHFRGITPPSPISPNSPPFGKFRNQPSESHCHASPDPVAQPGSVVAVPVESTGEGAGIFKGDRVGRSGTEVPQRGLGPISPGSFTEAKAKC